MFIAVWLTSFHTVLVLPPPAPELLKLPVEIDEYCLIF